VITEKRKKKEKHEQQVWGSVEKQATEIKQERITEALQKGLCTFSVTGSHCYVKHEKMCYCMTCGLCQKENENLAACESCGKKCHEGHDIKWFVPKNIEWYCDCGATNPDCQCLPDVEKEGEEKKPLKEEVTAGKSCVSLEAGLMLLDTIRASAYIECSAKSNETLEGLINDIIETTETRHD